nr:hypothetical protein [Tanacetum cinerariifolium]
REKEEFSEVKKARLLVELIEKRKKHFAALRTQEKRNKPPTKTQMKSQMSTYLKHIEIVLDDGDEVLIEATPISSRSLTIIDYKIHKKERRPISRSLEQMDIVKDRFKKEKPVDDMDNLLFRNLKTMVEHHVEDIIWKYQQGLSKLKNWKLFESCGVYCITMQSTIYYLLVEKVYQLTRNTVHKLWSDVRLQVDYDVEMAYDLLRFIRKQLME